MSDWPSGGANCHHLVVTPREVAVLCLVAGGLTNTEVAERLHISRYTVAQHIAGMLRRAQVRNRAELVARAYALGMLSVSAWPPQASDEMDSATTSIAG